MTDVFISYAREDQAHAASLAAAIEAAGLSVWWDREIRPGQAYNDEIGRAIEEARLVLVLWSRNAAASRYVKLEATEAFNADKIAQARLDDVQPPFPWRGLNWIDIGRGEAPWADLVAVAAERLGASPSSARARQAEGEARRTAASRPLSLIGVSKAATWLTWAPLIAATGGLGLAAADIIDTALLTPFLWGSAGAGGAGFLMTVQNMLAFTVAQRQGG